MKVRLRNPEMRAVEMASGFWRISADPNLDIIVSGQEMKRFFVAVPDLPVDFEAVIRIGTTPAPYLRPNVNTGAKPWVGAASRKEKARLHKVAKEVAEWYIASEDRHAPMFPDDAVVQVVVAWERRPMKNTGTLRYRQDVDAHDALPIMCKGLIDGLVEGGVLADDRHLLTNYSQTRDPAGAGYVEVKIKTRD